MTSSDDTRSAVLLDELLQHAQTSQIKRDNYRLKDKRKAGFVGQQKAKAN